MREGTKVGKVGCHWSVSDTRRPQTSQELHDEKTDLSRNGDYIPQEKQLSPITTPADCQGSKTWPTHAK